MRRMLIFVIILLLVPFSVQATLPSVSIYDVTFRFLSWCLVLLIGGTLLLSLLVLLIKAPSGNLVIRKIRKGYIILFGFLTVSLAGFFFYSLLFHPPFFAFEEHPILPTNRSQGLSQFGEKYDNPVLELKFLYPKAYDLEQEVNGHNSANIVLTDTDSQMSSPGKIHIEIMPKPPVDQDVLTWIRSHEKGLIKEDSLEPIKVIWYPAYQYRTAESCETEHTVFSVGERIFTMAADVCDEQVLKDSRAILEKLFLWENGRAGKVDPQWAPIIASTTPKAAGDAKTWPWFEEKTRGIAFAYPNFGEQAIAYYKDTDQGFEITISSGFDAVRQENSSEYKVIFTQNSEHLNLQEWFEKKMDDRRGNLLSSKAFVSEKLANDHEIIFLNQDFETLPEKVKTPEIEAVSISKTGNTIIRLYHFPNNSWNLPLREEMIEVYKDLLLTVTAP